MAPPDAPSCLLCRRPTYDPDKRERPWSRAVAAGQQVLICPACQTARPEWPRLVDRCPSCGSTRLGVVMGEVVCRQCGHVGASSVESGA
ncbi:MAG: hypothetical protein ABR518_00555 [Actinomycetota bacterium]